MKLLFTSPSLRTALVLLSNAVWKASGEFTKVGDGNCLDSSGQGYSFAEGVSQVFTQDNPGACYEWCTQANAEKLVGFENENLFCSCKLTKDSGAKCTDYTTPSASFCQFESLAEGAIEGARDYGNGKGCYRNDNFVPVTAAPVTAAPVTPSPTKAPVTLSPSAAPVTPGWNITYDSMKANLTAGGTEELIFVYNIPSSRAYEYKLFEKDCSTEIIGGNLITDNRTSRGSSPLPPEIQSRVQKILTIRRVTSTAIYFAGPRPDRHLALPQIPTISSIRLSQLAKLLCIRSSYLKRLTLKAFAEISCTTVKIGVESDPTMTMRRTEALSHPLALFQRPIHLRSSSYDQRQANEALNRPRPP
eukprot:scaffold106496_cov65-Cyclotella_meneghiniana.AAC.1